MNALSILMIAVVVLALNLGFIALAVQLGTHKLQKLLERLVALQMGAQQQVHGSLQQMPPSQR